MKVKVFRLENKALMVSMNYSESIEEIVNFNDIRRFDGEDYKLIDFEVKEMENKSYVILKYKKV